MSDDLDFSEIHWLLSIYQHLDLGLVVIDRNYQIRLWNGFMESHSSHQSNEVMGNELFELMPDAPREWLQGKIDSVFHLHTSAYSSWQQRPYICKFSSYRSITGRSEFMYQNVTFLPLKSTTGQTDLVCIIIYDQTTAAEDEMVLQHMSRTDGLTGLLNRKAWDQAILAEYKRSVRGSSASALLMLDIDHFKNVNDTFGHQAGDDVIRSLSKLISQLKRDSDTAGRYGGEEFAVILADTDSEGGLVFAERLRKLVESSPVTHGHNQIAYTISIGIADTPPLGMKSSDWMAAADKALYSAKETGRNKCVIAEAFTLDAIVDRLDD